MRYNIQLQVKQTVNRSLKLEVEADDEEAALEAARDALQTYPRAIYTGDSILRVSSTRDEYDAPSELSVINIRRDKRHG